MFLLVTRRKGHAHARLVESYDASVEAVRKHVGTHNPVDGCSSPPEEAKRRTQRGPEFHSCRSTSFGLRSGYVKPIGLDFDTAIG